MAKTKPTKIDNRSQLIYALTEVAELEHVLMCQYLFAAFTIKTRLEEFPNKDRRYHQVELTRKWKRLIMSVAREEMQHLAFAINLLVSVGGAPTFVRSNFPSLNRFFRTGPGDLGLEMSLERFGQDTIRRFVRFETNDPDADRKRLKLIMGVPDPNYYETLPDFYRAVKAGFTKDMFLELGPQYDPIDEGGATIRLRREHNLPNVVRSVEEAHALLDLIVQHGEGADVSDPEAHLHIFRTIRDELDAEIKIDPSFVASRNVVSNPLSRFHDDIRSDTKATYTIVPKEQDGGLQHNMLQIFNVAYEVLLGWLYQLFARQGSPQELRAIETLVFLPYMSEVIRPLGEVLTLVPVEMGKEPTLGPSFEVTSNNFITPAGTITAQLTREKLEELITRADDGAKALAKNKLVAVEKKFEPIRLTLRLLRDEFKSRVKKGWPPAPAQDVKDPAYQEDHKYSEAVPRGMWMGGGPPVLELEFQGWAQIRLATDPDGAEVRRGCTGNAFAIGDEPDLDRIIRLQATDAVIRSHCPAVSVNVIAAHLLNSPHQPVPSGKPVSGLVGASVALLGEPKFEGRNHLVSEDGEPIDPFELEIRTKSGDVLRRKVVGIPINDMDPVQRRGTGRYPVNLQVSIAAMRENMRRAGIGISPEEYTKERIRRLEVDLANVPTGEEASRTAEELRFRIAVFQDAKPGNIRWTRFFFDAEYSHTISGAMSAKVNTLNPKFSVCKPSPDDPAKWLVNYHFGFFDTDALSAYVFGKLWIPVDL
jgi:hypothetical protein